MHCPGPVDRGHPPRVTAARNKSKHWMVQRGTKTAQDPPRAVLPTAALDTTTPCHQPYGLCSLPKTSILCQLVPTAKWSSSQSLCFWIGATVPQFQIIRDTLTVCWAKEFHPWVVSTAVPTLGKEISQALREFKGTAPR